MRQARATDAHCEVTARARLHIHCPSWLQLARKRGEDNTSNQQYRRTTQAEGYLLGLLQAPEFALKLQRESNNEHVERTQMKKERSGQSRSKAYTQTEGRWPSGNALAQGRRTLSIVAVERPVAPLRNAVRASAGVASCGRDDQRGERRAHAHVCDAARKQRGDQRRRKTAAKASNEFDRRRRSKPQRHRD
jgi:hypothetical protein